MPSLCFSASALPRESLVSQFSAPCSRQRFQFNTNFPPDPRLQRALKWQCPFPHCSFQSQHPEFPVPMQNAQSLLCKVSCRVSPIELAASQQLTWRSPVPRWLPVGTSNLPNVPICSFSLCVQFSSFFKVLLQCKTKFIIANCNAKHLVQWVGQPENRGSPGPQKGDLPQENLQPLVFLKKLDCLVSQFKKINKQTL